MPTIIDGTNGIDKIAAGAIEYADLPTGSVLQVVQGSYAVQTTTSSNTYADTGLTATITPKFATSKILVLINNTECQKSSSAVAVRIKMNLCRNGSQILEFHSDLGYTNSTVSNTLSSSFDYLDSPATTSATTYKTQFASNGGAGAVYVQNSNIPSIITLMEIAA